MHDTGNQSGDIDHEQRKPSRRVAAMPALLGLRRGRFLPAATLRSGLIAAIAVLALGLPAIGVAENGDFDIADRPLTIGGQGVFGNLALVPANTASTINRVANPGDYDAGMTYVGYFSAEQCYRYEFSADDEAQRHFAPATCTDDTWDGNFLNWAATQMVDVFRKTLTGGYRVKDDVGVTWLEKAFHTGQTGEEGEDLYPERRITGQAVRDATPFSDAESLDIRISGLGNRMRFIVNGDGLEEAIDDLLATGMSEDDEEKVPPYNPAETEDGQPYDLNVRVSVCESGNGTSCVAYGDNWKPEGAIQANAGRLRYSVFSYLNDHSEDPHRDGGVMRARNKWVGPNEFDPDSGEASDNLEKEWNPETGVLVRNPNPEETGDIGASVTIEDSGVINFINQFGQRAVDELGEDNYPGHMPFHPVSELYYAALRYFRHQGDIDAYSRVEDQSGDVRVKRTEMFPVINDWDDPIGAWCEPNAILGIGDTFTDRDTNLVDADTATVIDFTNKVGELEGIGNIGDNWTGDGFENTAFISGLAYQAHTTDIRTDLTEGDTTVSTFWLDILRDDKGRIEPPESNQFYLAAKYGGFTVPSDYDPLARSEELPGSWWHNNEMLRTTDGGEVERPFNYYPASRASEMVGELDNAFDAIVSDLSGSSSAIAANSTRLDTGTLIYQARFNTADWSGQLLAIEVDPEDGSIDTSDPKWDAGDKIPSHGNRDIFSIAPDGRNGILFEEGTNGVTPDQMNLLDINIDGNNDGLGTDRLAYLRGVRDNEVQNGGIFRERSTLLGDIVNSDPAFVGADNFGYSVGGTEESAFEYGEFRRAKHEFDRPMIYVGSNNGMLHGFHAETGNEELAYVPNEVYGKLSALTSPSYAHQYYVDGSARHGDAYIDRGNGAEWRTYLVGSTGAGGRAVFALDIPDPNNKDFLRNDVLWEFTHPELGAAMAQPHIARMNDDRWYVIFGNGYNSESGNAGLFLVPLDDPDDYVFIDTGVGGSADAANGLSNTTPVDVRGNRTTDYIYGGDMQGNMWRFDVTRDAPRHWGVDVVFSASDGTDPQPITAAPEVGPHPSGEGRMIFFGTGKFFEVGDNQVPNDAQTQTFYGIHDTGGSLTRADLHEQTIVASSEDFRVIGDTPVPENKDGWYIDLPTNGERVFNRATLRNERIIFVTNIPTADVCGFGGDSWIMEMNAFLGTGVTEQVFVDEDGADQFEEGTADGMRLNDMVSRPAIIDTAGDTEFKYLSGSSGAVTQVEESSTTDRLGRRSWREF